MAFLDNVGKTISKTGQDVAQTTKNFAAINKLEGLIAKENEKIKNYYCRIGQKYCEIFCDKPAVELIDLVQIVKTSQEEIRKYNEQIKEIKGIAICPSCGKDIPYLSVFCNSCGAKMYVRKKEEKIPEGYMKCKKCAKILPLNFKFCTFCGEVLGSLALKENKISNENKEINHVLP